MNDTLKDIAVLVVGAILILGIAVIGARYMTPYLNADFLIVNGQPPPKSDRLTVVSKTGCPTSQEGF